MGTDILINLALGDFTPGALGVRPADRAGQFPVEQLIAVWCEAEPGKTLYQVIVESRAVAVELHRPLAIFTRRAEFDLSVFGVCRFHDHWWMPTDRWVNEPIDVAVHRYDQAIASCPLGRVVLVVGVADWLTDDLAAYVRACGALAHQRPEVVGLVWIGRPAVEAVGDVSPEDLADLPGPPQVEDIEPIGWGHGV
jgi:hypothetical protein